MRAHVYVCTGVCVCVCVYVCVCVCAHVIEKGIWAHLFSRAHLHNGQGPALGAKEVRLKLIEDQESETRDKTSKTITESYAENASP